MTMNTAQITKCIAREILDSRGHPTVEAAVFLSDGTVGIASAPSGASTGIYEAHELRDRNSERFGGRGVRTAVEQVSSIISPALSGIPVSDQTRIDCRLIELDETPNKERLGANALLAVSLACARAAANSQRIPLFRYLGGVNAGHLPVPMMNILNGGAHAQNNVEIQEFMIVPTGFPSYHEALRAGSEIYHTLGTLLRRAGLASGIGDEGGFAPSLQTDEDAIEWIIKAIEQSGYTTDQVKIALDAAASEWYTDGGEYVMPRNREHYRREQLIDRWVSLVERYPICSIEDGLDQRDFEGWHMLTERLGERIMLVGDDLFVTNEQRLRTGIEKDAANAILIKPNQIGTLTETMRVIRLAKQAGYHVILSHRSGETEDTTIADIAVALHAPLIKAGAPCRSERVAKYNRLLRIESFLHENAAYGLDFSTKKAKKQHVVSV